jgi:pimeloyl-CoA dehydrogenase large subunit
MDLNFTAEELAFRDEMRGFFRGEFPRDIRRKVAEGRALSRDEIVNSHRALNAQGLAVPAWPKEWGGRDWTPVQYYFWQDEMQQACVPSPLQFNASMIGPVIARFGSEEQKRRFLPRAANLDDWWCQGFSEPGAGSDLASLRTRADRRGDSYIVNGQKTWTTLAQHADWMFCLVRTDPAAKRQQGISFLVFPMASKGVTVRPIQTIDGGHEVNEVFLDDVEVPGGNLIGEENKGWDYAKFLLGHERTGIARIGICKARVQRIKELAALEVVCERPLIEDVRFREKLAAVEVELKALEMTQLRVVAEERRRTTGEPNPASSILKLKGSVIQQRLTELALEVVGPFALPLQPAGEGRNEPSLESDYEARVAPDYFNFRKVSIYGGSNEIQRNIVAKAILGL